MAKSLGLEDVAFETGVVRSGSFAKLLLALVVFHCVIVIGSPAFFGGGI